MTPMPYISALKNEEWKRLSPSERIAGLNALEVHLAAQDGRDPCQVSIEPLNPFENGVHYFDSDDAEHIAINPRLLQSEQPYQAVETLFHEDRHAHQYHHAQNADNTIDESPLRDWGMSINGGYIEPADLSYSSYRWQPVEKDAYQKARANTDALYEETFQDAEAYPAYKAEKEQEIQDQVNYAQNELGENYEEEARQAVQAKYQAKMDMNQDRGSITGQDAEATKTSSEPEPSQPNKIATPSESSGTEAAEEDNPYDYGYGL